MTNIRRTIVWIYICHEAIYSGRIKYLAKHQKVVLNPRLLLVFHLARYRPLFGSLIIYCFDCFIFEYFHIPSGISRFLLKMVVYMLLKHIFLYNMQPGANRIVDIQ